MTGFGQKRSFTGTMPKVRFRIRKRTFDVFGRTETFVPPSIQLNVRICRQGYEYYFWPRADVARYA
jgi:hypothetical protein